MYQSPFAVPWQQLVFRVWQFQDSTIPTASITSFKSDASTRCYEYQQWKMAYMDLFVQVLLLLRVLALNQAQKKIGEYMFITRHLPISCKTIIDLIHRFSPFHSDSANVASRCNTNNALLNNKQFYGQK